jgi:antitoxin Phd
MGRAWQLQEAKNKLSEVVDEAMRHGPQVITRRGVQVAIVVSCTDFVRLEQKKTSLSTFFRRSPLVGLRLERDTSPPRGNVVL